MFDSKKNFGAPRIRPKDKRKIISHVAWNWVVFELTVHLHKFRNLRYVNCDAPYHNREDTKMWRRNFALAIFKKKFRDKFVRYQQNILFVHKSVT